MLEEHKIRAFIAMVEGLQAVGVPLPEQGDAKAIELWPLVQAYALQVRYLVITPRALVPRTRLRAVG